MLLLLVLLLLLTSLLQLHNFTSTKPSRAIFYETWGRKSGDPPNAQCCGYGDFEGMNSLTAHGYSLYQVRTMLLLLLRSLFLLPLLLLLLLLLTVPPKGRL